MTKLEQLTRAAVKKLAESRGLVVKEVRHIFPRAYVLGRPGASCLLVACPPQDKEAHLKGLKVGEDGTNIIRCFDGDFKAGDWCSVAYVSSESAGEQMAVPAVELT